MKHSIAALACAAALVVSLSACGGADKKAALPSTTATPSTTAASQPTTTPPTASATASGPVALVPHSTYTYGGLKLVVNLPAEIPSESRPSMRVFSEFLQADGRTTARSKLDPALTGLAAANVVKDTQASITAESVQGIGSVTYTVSKVQTVTHGPTLITGCLDQSKLVHVRKDGSHFVAQAKKYPTLKMTANIKPGQGGPEVTLFAFADGPC